MNKILFLICGPLAVCCFVFLSSDSSAQADNKNQLVSRLMKINDELVSSEMGRQLTVAGVQYSGALFDLDSVVSPIKTAHFLQTLICSYVSPESKHFRSPELLSRMVSAAQALLNLQHEDGTIDLLTTNFHSTPDLGFTIFPVAHTYAIIEKHRALSFGKLPGFLKRYMLNAGEALSVGGIHTPNHRWVVSAALAWIHSFFPDPKYIKRVEQWLAEKIDIDADGQYNERSTAVYTPVTNRSLLDIARKLRKTELYDVVRRNLNLTFYFVHANGEIATESSNRQDKYLQSNLAKYYQAYNYMALLDNSKPYAGMVAYIRSTVPDHHLHYMLPVFLEDSRQLKQLPSPEPIPTSYHKYFRHSDMVRIREGEVDMSVIKDNPIFFTFFKNGAALEAIRLSSAFFGKGQFKAETLEKEGSGYLLTSTLHGPYYQPLPREKIPAEGDAWNQVPRSEREQSEVQTLHTRIYITPNGKKATIRIVVDGPENLPVTLELAFREGGTLRNVMPKRGIAQAFLAKEGEYFIYEHSGDSLRVGPGVLNHQWTQLRGALPKLDADCLYMTNYAPFEFEFTIE